MVGNATTLTLSDDLIFALQSANDTIHSCQEVILRDKRFIMSSSDKCRLITYIRNISTRKSRCLTRQERTIQIWIKFQLLQVNIEDLLSLLNIGQANINLTIKTSCAQQRLIQNIGTVRCRQDDNSSICLETIHLRKQLVECVFTLIITRETCILTACTTNRVDLVDKQDTWRLLLSLLK